MTILYRQCSPFQEPASTECSHRRSGIARGVVSRVETGTSKILPVGYGYMPIGSMWSCQAANCGCEIPTYLIGLDEPLFDYALANFIESFDRKVKTERTETYDVSSLTKRAELHRGLH